jgi:hypothetical protein
MRDWQIGRLRQALVTQPSHARRGLVLIDDVVVGIATLATLPVPGRMPTGQDQTAFPKAAVRSAFRVLHFNVQCE